MAASWPVAATAPSRIILEADPISDYDDPVTVLLAATAPEFDFLGLVVGGSDIPTSVAAARRLLRVAGRDDVGVYAGVSSTADRPAFEYFSQYPPRRWGHWPRLQDYAQAPFLDPPAADGVAFYLDAIRAHPEGVTVIVCGPLSTLAAAMRQADAEGNGTAFRQGIEKILFSGGDFDTSEWNLYEDIPAARLVFGSGVPIWQFGGEDAEKAYFRWPERQRLWQARTPIASTLREIYGLYDAGWDPTAPFTPILYDVHPLALLLEGERFSTFEPVAVEIGPQGHLRRVDGPPNIHTRVRNRGPLLVSWTLERLGDGRPGAANHLRSLRRSIPSDDPSYRGLPEELDAAVEAALHRDRATVGPLLDSLQARLESVDGLPDDALWHLRTAREFLFGVSGEGPWTDPNTALAVAEFRLRALVTKRQLVAGGIVLLLAALALYGWRRSRKGRASEAGA